MGYPTAPPTPLKLGVGRTARFEPRIYLSRNGGLSGSKAKYGHPSDKVFYLLKAFSTRNPRVKLVDREGCEAQSFLQNNFGDPFRGGIGVRATLYETIKVIWGIFSLSVSASGKCGPLCYALSGSLKNSGSRHSLIQSINNRSGQDRGRP